MPGPGGGVRIGARDPSLFFIASDSVGFGLGST